MNILSLFRGIAAFVFALGLAMSAQSFLKMRNDAGLLASRGSELQQLYTLQSQHQRDLEAVGLFEKLAVKKPESIHEIVRSVIPDAQASIRLKGSHPTVPGWSVQNVEISMDGIRLADFARLIQRAGSQRPPWRLTEITITATEKGAGYGRITAVFEALEKNGGS